MGLCRYMLWRTRVELDGLPHPDQENSGPIEKAPYVYSEQVQPIPPMEALCGGEEAGLA